MMRCEARTLDSYDNRDNCRIDQKVKITPLEQSYLFFATLIGGLNPDFLLANVENGLISHNTS